MRPRPVPILGFMLLISVAASAQTIQANGVVNAAGSGHNTTVAPGSLISIFGSGLAGALSTANSIPISTKLGDVDSVTINGTAAPLIFVSDGQSNAQVPWGVGTGQANVVGNRAGAVP